MSRQIFSRWLFRHLITWGRYSQYARLRLVRFALLIALVMIPLILSVICMDGMMEGITNKYIMLQDGHLQLHWPEPISDDPSFLQQVDDRIESADYVVVGHGILYSRTTTSEVRIKGVDPSYFNEKRRSQFTFSGDIFAKQGNLASVMLSRSTAQKLGVEVGDRVALMVVPDTAVAVVRPALATVSAVYSSGYHALDSTLLFMAREDALRLFPAKKNARTELLVKSEASDYLEEIELALEHYSGQQYQYATWDQFNQTVYQNFITSRQVIFFIFLLIMIVAGVYIASIAQEMVQDSTQSIALFKTIGATTRQLGVSYYCTVTLVTLIGLVVGIGVGIAIGSVLDDVLSLLGRSGIAALQYYLLDFPFVVSWTDIGGIFIAMLAIAGLAVWISLRRIAKISPLELLQQD